jgi:serine/threonine-protein kinase
LKVFRREFSRDEELASRLYQQVELAAKLCGANPRLVEVYECGRAEDGRLFVVMEYVQGRSLKDIIRQAGPLDVERTLRLAGQIAEGLGAIHDAGHVHAQVRPQNILVVGEGGEESAKLKGLEVAGLTDAGLVEQMIHARVLPGTPEYVAPEQVEGERPTPRTDIYAFGALLYEALSGVAPLTASNPDHLLAKQLQEAPLALQERRPEIPPAVELKVMQALEKEPERRQRYVTDVANEYLCQLAADELFVERAKRKYGSAWRLVTTVQAWTADPKGIFLDPEEGGIRRRAVAAAAGLVLLLAVVVAWLLLPRDLPEQRAAQASRQALGEIRPAESPDIGRTAQGAGELATPGGSAPALPEPRAVDDRSMKPIEEPARQERAEAGDREEQAQEPSAPPLPRVLPPRAPETERPPQEPARRPARVEAPAKRPAPRTPLIETPPPPPRPATPRRPPEAPDPSEIIDWLFQRSGG